MPDNLDIIVSWHYHFPGNPCFLLCQHLAREGWGSKHGAQQWSHQTPQTLTLQEVPTAAKLHRPLLFFIPFLWDLKKWYMIDILFLKWIQICFDALWDKPWFTRMKIIRTFESVVFKTSRNPFKVAKLYPMCIAWQTSSNVRPFWWTQSKRKENAVWGIWVRFRKLSIHFASISVLCCIILAQMKITT